MTRRFAAAVVVGWLVYQLLEDEADYINDRWAKAMTPRSAPTPCTDCAGVQEELHADG